MKSISDEQISERLLTENPWWTDPDSSELPYSRMSPRPYLDLLYPLLSMEVRRAIVVMGPRRVGKTVMLFHSIRRLIEEGVDPKSICYVSVDHPLYNGLGLERLLESYSKISGIDYRKKVCYLFFDEIQYLRDWEIHLKSIVDSYPQARCIASGSAAAALRLKSNESGAGRFTDFMLPPLTFYEYLELLNKSELVKILHVDQGRIHDLESPDIESLNREFLDYINFGGYPEVALSSEIRRDPNRFIKNDIIDKVLLRDLPSLYGINDVQELNYLFTSVAYNTANEVSLENLSQDSGVSKPTIKKYLEYLEAAFLIRKVYKIDQSAKRFMRASQFKVYLTNPSMRTALFGKTESDDPDMGDLVETAIFSQWFHSDQPINYARWKNGEVDIVGLNQGQVVSWALEVKWTDRFFDKPSELKSLLDFCHTHNKKLGWATSRTRKGIKTCRSVDIHFMPASLYCYQLGHNIVNARVPETIQ